MSTEETNLSLTLKAAASQGGAAGAKALDSLGLIHEDKALATALQEVPAPDLMSLLNESPESIAGALVTPTALLEALQFLGASWPETTPETARDHGLSTHGPRGDLERFLLAAFRSDASDERLRDLTVALATFELAAECLVFLNLNKGAKAFFFETGDAYERNTHELVIDCVRIYAPEVFHEARVLSENLGVSGKTGIETFLDPELESEFCFQFLSDMRELALETQRKTSGSPEVAAKEEEFFPL